MNQDNGEYKEAGAAQGNRLAASSGVMVWQVGALCHAVAHALDARFNPVAVRGEISGFSRASSGHCYFNLKDHAGQIRCAMFRRAAGLVDFEPRDGELVEVRGRLGVYEQRGDLQLVVESMRRAGQGALFEQFLVLKAKLEAQGLFDSGRKRMPVPLPRGVGVVTSLGAAALHDVLTALARRVPHIPVVLAPAAVQGAGAAAELVRALSNLYQYIKETRWHPGYTPIDVILLVRGGGSLDDLWSFNSEALVNAIAQSPVPIICGVGHETDFTLADFVADVRAPTPTAAAELVCPPSEVWLGALEVMQERLVDAIQRRLDTSNQRLDAVTARMGRPSNLMARQQRVLLGAAHGMRHGVASSLVRSRESLKAACLALPRAAQSALAQNRQRLARAELRLGLLDPSLVLQRGYAWLQDDQGKALTRAAQVAPGQQVYAKLADGALDMEVRSVIPQTLTPQAQGPQ